MAGCVRQEGERGLALCRERSYRRQAAGSSRCPVCYRIAPNMQHDLWLSRAQMAQVNQTSSCIHMFHVPWSRRLAARVSFKLKLASGPTQQLLCYLCYLVLVSCLVAERAMAKAAAQCFPNRLVADRGSPSQKNWAMVTRSEQSQCNTCPVVELCAQPSSRQPSYACTKYSNLTRHNEGAGSNTHYRVMAGRRDQAWCNGPIQGGVGPAASPILTHYDSTLHPCTAEAADHSGLDWLPRTGRTTGRSLIF